MRLAKGNKDTRSCRTRLHFLASARAKLRDTRGDSLVESLAAMLIAAMATLLLAMMVTTAANASMSSQTRLDALHKAESTLAVATAGAGTKTAVTISGPGIDPVSAPIALYSNDTFMLYVPRPGASS